MFVCGGDRNTELEEALERIDMEAFLDQEGIEYKVTRGSRGTQLNVKECPFCGNSNWKVYLNADTGLGNCFHGDCEEKMNKWKFIRAVYSSAAPVEVIGIIKNTAKVQGWKPVKKSVAVEADTGDLHLPANYKIPINGKGVKYLTDRGFSIDCCQYFDFRLCHNGRFDYLTPEGKKAFQDYSKRIIIPIYDMSGELASFQGRDITGTSEKKYLFPPGFASTGSILYNGHNAIGVPHLVMGEGVFDVAAIKIAMDSDMSLRSIGQIGSFGKHLSFGDSNSQLAKLIYLKERGLTSLTYMWDGERQAILDAIESAILVKRYGILTRVAILPEDKDPNEVHASEVIKAFRTAITITNKTAIELRLKYRGK